MGDHRSLTFTVAGHPTPGGSFRAIITGGHAHIVPGGDNNQRRKLNLWRGAVQTATEEALARARHDGFDGPVHAVLTFTLPKPKSLPKWRWLPWSKSAGDIDKLARSTLDALVDGGAMVDDSRVCELVARKLYADTPGAKITLSPIPERTTDG